MNTRIYSCRTSPSRSLIRNLK
ncbi:MAG: hypothetical protein JSR46_09635 [Verrucomicrobia bacterium]|nr:hypothetical protein [Verrucomicrobiota bacterium]